MFSWKTLLLTSVLPMGHLLSTILSQLKSHLSQVRPKQNRFAQPQQIDFSIYFIFSFNNLSFWCHCLCLTFEVDGFSTLVGDPFLQMATSHVTTRHVHSVPNSLFLNQGVVILPFKKFCFQFIGTWCPILFLNGHFRLRVGDVTIFPILAAVARFF